MDDQTAGTPGRTESFGQGVNGTPGQVQSSLNEDSAVFNQKVAGSAYNAHSVLQPLQSNPGGNGMSAQDASEKRDMLGNYMGSGNGTSADQYQQTSMLRMQGNDEG